MHQSFWVGNGCLHGKEDRSGERVPERAERFKKTLDAPGIVDAATDSPNAPERGGRRSGVGAKHRVGGPSLVLLDFKWWLPGPDSKS